MPKIVKPLTPAQVRDAKPRDKTYTLFDGKGLYLNVPPTGLRTWRLKFRLLGKDKLMGLGSFPDVSLAEARAQRQKARELMREGIDPIAHRQQQRREDERMNQTFEGEARNWHQSASKDWSKKYSDRVIRRLEIDVIPAIGSRPISEIRRADIVSVLEAMQERGVGETAYRAARDLEAIFDYAQSRELVSGNPAARITTKKAQVVRKRKVEHFAAITEKSQLGGLLRAVAGYRGDSQGITKLGIEILALTMVRPGELRHCTWDEIDFDAKLWEIPADRMKMGREHLVPLSRQALAKFQELHKITGKRKLVLPGVRNPRRPLSDNTFNAALRNMGYDKTQMTAHGFRATASTILNEEGWNRDWIERQLAHFEQSNSRRPYNRAEYLKGRTQMLQAWADLLTKLEAG